MILGRSMLMLLARITIAVQLVQEDVGVALLDLQIDHVVARPVRKPHDAIRVKQALTTRGGSAGRSVRY